MAIDTIEPDLNYDPKAFSEFSLDDPVFLGTPKIEMPLKAASEDAMITGILESGDYNENQFKALRNSLIERGVDPVVEGLRKRIADERNKDTISQTFQDAVGKPNPTAFIEQTLASTKAFTEDDILEFNREFFRYSLARSQAKTPEEKFVVERQFEELVRRGYPWQIAVADRMNLIISKMSSNPLDIAAGELSDFLPFVYNVSFAKAFKKVFPEEDISVLGFSRGQLPIEFRKRFDALTPVEKLEVANDFMDAVTENDGFLTGNEYQQVLILQDALQGEFGDLSQWMGNAITLLDFLVLGGAVRQVWQRSMNSFLPGSVISTTNIVDDPLTSKLIASAIEKDLSPAVGMSSKELVEIVATPSGWEKGIEVAPQNLFRQFQGGTAQIDDLLQGTKGNPLIIKESEKALSIQELRDQTGKVGESVRWESNYEAKAGDESIVFSSLYGRINAAGNPATFKTPQAAHAQALRDFPTATSILVEKSVKGILKKLPPSKTGYKNSKRTGEFLYRINDERTYATVISKSDKFFFPDGTVVQSGPSKKFIFDSASRFSKWMSGAYGQAGDFGRGVAHRIGQIGKPFNRLSDTKKREVVRLLQKYAKESDTMDFTDVMAAANRDGGVLSGFIAYRQTMDALWHLENRFFRKDLMQQGVVHIDAKAYQGMGVALNRTGASDNFKKIGTPKGTTDPIIIEVFDPRKGKVVTMTEREVFELYDKKTRALFRVKEPIGPLEKQVDLVLVGAKEVRQLPAAVLNKRDGHITRYYKDSYFINVVRKGTLNGIPETNIQILKVVASRSHANAVKAEMLASKKYKGAEISIVRDRALSATERSQLQMQDNISLGRLFYHKRADQRLAGFEGLAEISDTVEALVKNIDSTSKYVSHFDLQTTMKTRWMNTYGSGPKGHGLVKANATFPNNKAEIGLGHTPDPKIKADAIEAWEKIKGAESIMTWEGQLWRDGIIRISEAMIGESSVKTFLGRRILNAAEAVKWTADHSPNNLFRGLAFNHLIAMNPFRQAYIQAQQYWFISVLAPTQVPQILMQNKAIMVGLLKDLSPALYARTKDTAAKVMGMSTKEYDHFMKMFGDTGMPHSVNSHDFVTNAFIEFSGNISLPNNALLAALTKAQRTLRNTAAGTLNTLKNIGFGYGELSNLINSFLVARHRFLKATGKKSLVSKKDFLETADDARAIALDMTRSGAFRYQDGFFSAFTQFLSIQHKAVLAVMPFNKSIGNQAFTLKERRKLLMGQLVLNGVKGLGLYTAYREIRDRLGLDIPDEVEDYIIGGMYESIINETLNLLFEGPEIDHDISSSVAPIQGINQNVADWAAIALGNKPYMDAFASTNVLNRYGDAIKIMRTLYEFPTLREDKDFFDYFEIMASATSGYNQFIRARAAVRFGQHVSTNGSPTVKAAFESAVLLGTLGIAPRTMEEFYLLQEEFASGTIGVTDVLVDDDREASLVAQDLLKAMTQIVTLYTDEFDADLEDSDHPKLVQLHQQKMREALRMRTALLALYDPIERDRIWSAFDDLVSQDRVTGASKLIEGILKKVFTGQISGDAATRTINRLRASDIYDPNTPQGAVIEHNIKILLDNMSKREALSDQNLQNLQENANGSP